MRKHRDVVLFFVIRVPLKMSPSPLRSGILSYARLNMHVCLFLLGSANRLLILSKRPTIAWMIWYPPHRSFYIHLRHASAHLHTMVGSVQSSKVVTMRGLRNKFCRRPPDARQSLLNKPPKAPPKEECVGDKTTTSIFVSFCEWALYTMSASFTTRQLDLYSYF